MGLFDRFKKPDPLLERVVRILPEEYADAVSYAVKKQGATVISKEYSIGNSHAELLQIKGEIGEEINALLKQQTYDELFEAFAKDAHNVISASIAPHIHGMETIKRAVALQLACQSRVHILLLGDPGTGKTDILRAAAELAPHSVFGLGSGTSKAGLSLAYVKGELHEGLLPQANGGICCIDELNLMKKADQAGLYNAMEKGFVSYSKGGRDETAPADVRVLATANPKNDVFENTTQEQIKKQLPFSEALLSRFHLLFIVHKPDEETFKQIAQQVVRAQTHDIDTEFITAYLLKARERNPRLNKAQEQQIIDAAAAINAQADNLLINVSPRLVKGLKELSLAHARLHNHKKVTSEDVTLATQILQESLNLT